MNFAMLEVQLQGRKKYRFQFPAELKEEANDILDHYVTQTPSQERSVLDE